MALHMTRLSGARQPSSSHGAGGRYRGGSSYAENARRSGMVNMTALSRADADQQEMDRRQAVTRRIRGQFDVSADDHDLGAPVANTPSGGWHMLRGIAAMLTFGGNGDRQNDGEAGNASDGSDDMVQALDGTVDVKSLRGNETKRLPSGSVASLGFASDSDDSTGSRTASGRFDTMDYNSVQFNSVGGSRYRGRRRIRSSGTSSQRQSTEADAAIAEALDIGEEGGGTISGVRGRLRSITERVGGGRRFSTVAGQSDDPELAQAIQDATAQQRGASGPAPAGLTTRALAQQAESRRLQEQVHYRRIAMQRGTSRRQQQRPSRGSQFGSRQHTGNSFIMEGASKTPSSDRLPSSGEPLEGIDNPAGSPDTKRGPGGAEAKYRLKREGGAPRGVLKNAPRSLRKRASRRRHSNASDAADSDAVLHHHKQIFETMDQGDETLEHDDLHNAFKEGNLLDSNNVKVGPSCRAQVQHLMIATSFGVGLDLGNALLSLAACFLYVIETYMIPNGTADTPFERDAETVISISEMSLSAFFTVDFLLRLFITEPFYNFLLTWNALLDLLTIIPVFVTAFITTYNTDAAAFLSILALARVFRVLRIIRLYRTFEYIENEVTKQSVRIGLTIMSLLFVAAGLFQITESFNFTGDETEGISFFESLWFCVVTITTVGYGDVAPTNDAGRALVIIIILTAFFAIPLETNKLLELLAHQSEYALAYYTPPEKSSREATFVQVLVVGNVHSASIQDFFRELLHPDHSVSVHVVVLHPMHPSDYILDIMAEPEMEQKITYIQGSPMHGKDLIRAHIHTADGCFILTNKLTVSPEAEDASAMLTALGIKKHVMSHGAHDINMYMQLIKPESKRHLMATMPPEMSLTVVCTEQLTMNLLSMNVVCPGLNTMLFNLMASDDSGEPTPDELLIEGGDRLEDYRWYQEYRRGKGFEIYRTSLSKAFALIPFYLAADVVYRHTSAMMFGLELSDQFADGYEEQIRIVLNPGAMPIPAQKGVRVKAFVIASDKATADLVGLGHARAKKDTISASANKSLQELRKKLEYIKEQLTSNKTFRKKVKRVRRKSHGMGSLQVLDQSKLDVAALQALGGGGPNLPPGYRMRSAGGSKEYSGLPAKELSTEQSGTKSARLESSDTPTVPGPAAISPTRSRVVKLKKLDSSAEVPDQPFRPPMTVAAMDAHQRELLGRRSQQQGTASLRRGSGSGIVARQPFTTTNRDGAGAMDRAAGRTSTFGFNTAQAEFGPGASVQAAGSSEGEGQGGGKQFKFGSGSEKAVDITDKPIAGTADSKSAAKPRLSVDVDVSDSVPVAASSLGEDRPPATATGHAGSGSDENAALLPGAVPSNGSIEGEIETGGESLHLTSPAGQRIDGEVVTPAGDSLELSVEMEPHKKIPAPVSGAEAPDGSVEQENASAREGQGPQLHIKRRSRVSVVALGVDSDESESGSGSGSDGLDETDSGPIAQAQRLKNKGISNASPMPADAASNREIPEASGGATVAPEKLQKAMVRTSTASGGGSAAGVKSSTTGPASSVAPSDARALRAELVQVKDIVVSSSGSGASEREAHSGDTNLSGESPHDSFRLQRASGRPNAQHPSRPCRPGTTSAGRALLRQHGASHRSTSSPRPPRRLVADHPPLVAKYNSDDDMGIRIAAFRLDNIVARLKPEGKRLARMADDFAPVATRTPPRRRPPSGRKAKPARPVPPGGFRSSVRAEAGSMYKVPSKSSMRRSSVSGTGIERRTGMRQRRLSWDPNLDRSGARLLQESVGFAGSSQEDDGGVHHQALQPAAGSRGAAVRRSVSAEEHGVTEPSKPGFVGDKESSGPSHALSSSMGQSGTTIGSSISRHRSKATPRELQSPQPAGGLALTPHIGPSKSLSASSAWLDAVLEKPQDRYKRGRETMDLWTTQGIASAHHGLGFVEKALPEQLWVQHFVEKAKRLNKVPAMLRAELGDKEARLRQRRQSDQALQVVFADSQFGMRSTAGGGSDMGSPKKSAHGMFADQFGGVQHREQEALAIASAAAGYERGQAACTTEDVLHGAARFFKRRASPIVTSRLTGLLSQGPPAASKSSGDVLARRHATTAATSLPAGGSQPDQRPRSLSGSLAGPSPSFRMMQWANAGKAHKQERPVTDSIGYGVGVSPAAVHSSKSSSWGAKPPLPGSASKPKASNSSARGLAAIRAVGRKAAMMSSVNQAISEPARWRRRYYLRQVPIKLHAATMFSVRNKKGFEGHVIISGSVNNLLHIIKPLRSRILSRCVPIVLLHAQAPTDVDWKRISAFQEVYFVQGSPLSEEALGRAGIRTAACAIVLSGRDSGVLGRAAATYIEHTDATTGVTTTQGGLVDKVTLIDSEALFYAQAMLRMQPQLTTVVELIKFSNSVFLKPDVQAFRHLADDSQTSSSPMFASGSIFSPVLLDVLLCQSFFNPPIVVILEMLVLGAEGSTGRRTGTADTIRGMSTMRGGGAMSTRVFKGKYATSARKSMGGAASGTDYSGTEKPPQLVDTSSFEMVKTSSVQSVAGTPAIPKYTLKRGDSKLRGVRATRSGELRPPPAPESPSLPSKKLNGSLSQLGGGSDEDAPAGDIGGSGIQIAGQNVNEKALKRLGLSKETTEAGGSIEMSDIGSADENSKKKKNYGKRRGSILGSFLPGFNPDSDDENEGLLGDDDQDKERRRKHKMNRRRRRAKRRAKMQAMQAAGNVNAIELSSSSSETDEDASSGKDSYSSADEVNSATVMRSKKSRQEMLGLNAPSPLAGLSDARIPARPSELVPVGESMDRKAAHMRWSEQKGIIDDIVSASHMSGMGNTTETGTHSRSTRLDTHQSSTDPSAAAPQPFDMKPKFSSSHTATSADVRTSDTAAAAAFSTSGIASSQPASVPRAGSYRTKKKSSRHRRSSKKGYVHKISHDADGMYTGKYEDESEEEESYKDKSTLGKLLKRVRRSRVMNIPVPPRFYNKPYHMLTSYMLRELQIVPLGLYRGVYRRHGIVSAGNDHPYVVTNPDPQCEITSADGVYALGPIKDLQTMKASVVEKQSRAMGGR